MQSQVLGPKTSCILKTKSAYFHYEIVLKGKNFTFFKDIFEKIEAV